MVNHEGDLYRIETSFVDGELYQSTPADEGLAAARVDFIRDYVSHHPALGVVGDIALQIDNLVDTLMNDTSLGQDDIADMLHAIIAFANRLRDNAVYLHEQYHEYVPEEHPTENFTEWARHTQDFPGDS